MPSESRAQNRFMHAVAEGKVPSVPKKVGADFVAADAGRNIRALPQHVLHLRARLSAAQKRPFPSAPSGDGA